MAEFLEGIEKSHRTLAAIVFTDIVSFSALTQADEVKTLRLANRDLDLIRKICKDHEGRVLKCTGDGLLMYFDSAVQAVACAMRAQEAITAMGRQLPAGELLKHRIGIHLGDVFVGPDDVMGDGVNIASRLQEEAPPGCICVSQTVYDVVKNRLGVKITPLGPRELKNIKEAMPVYQILLEAAGAKARVKGSRARMWKILSIAAVAVVVVFAGVWITVSFMRSRAEPEKKVISDTKPVSEEEKLNQARRDFLPRRDFAGMVRWLETNKPGRSSLYEYRMLMKYKRMVATRLRITTKDDPIVIPARRLSGRIQLWGDGAKVVIKTNGQINRQSVGNIPNRLMVRVYMAMARSPRQRKLAAFFRRECELAGMLKNPE